MSNHTLELSLLDRRMLESLAEHLRGRRVHLKNFAFGSLYGTPRDAGRREKLARYERVGLRFDAGIAAVEAQLAEMRADIARRRLESSREPASRMLARRIEHQKRRIAALARQPLENPTRLRCALEFLETLQERHRDAVAREGGAS